MQSNVLHIGYILKGDTYTYKIEKILGQGSFGITYLASTTVTVGGALGDIETTIKVAVKEFFMDEINGREGSTVTMSNQNGICEKYKHQFAREARNLSQLKHKNIVKVLETFEGNNTIYYTMEFCEGGSLNDLIEARGKLNEKECMAYISEITSALSFMHAHNVLHLDLKPGNIMLRKDGSVALIDFGLSKQYDENGKPESSTNIGGGTPGYAPLEQSNYKSGDKLATTLDIYALGGTMFKMLTGERPPTSSEILNEGFPTDLLNSKGVSEKMIQCIEKAMESMKKNRFQTVTELVAALGDANASAASEETEKGSYNNPKSEETENTQRKNAQTQQKQDTSIHKQHKATEEQPKKGKGLPKWRKVVFVIQLIVVALILLFAVIGGVFNRSSSSYEEESVVTDSMELVESAALADSVAMNVSVPEQNKPEPAKTETKPQAQQQRNTPRTAQEWYELAEKSGDYDKSGQYYIKAANMGHSAAQFNVGYMYDMGYGVSQDYAEAMKWYRKAAEQGYDYAQISLGDMYNSGEGVSQDYAEAMKWYRKAAEQGNMYAIADIGEMYYYGRGVSKDNAEALKWLKKAAGNGYNRVSLIETIEQELLAEEEQDEPFFSSEVMPTFQGGDINSFRTWIMQRLQYPATAAENNIQGRVTVQFIVDKDGSITNIEVLSSPDKSLSDEVIRVMNSAPRWSPGLQRGIPVKVRHVLPVEFKIQS